jgi:hypothetical protein
MNFGTLLQVKTRLLVNPQNVARTTWDDTITQIASGVEKAFDKFCNRQFVRAEGGTDTFTADRETWILSRYPVETITTIEMRSGLNAGWQDQGAIESFVQDWNADSGLVQFGSLLGSALDRVRITYTGGYAQVPEDVVEAWLIQCKEVFSRIDPLGLEIGNAAIPDKLPDALRAELQLVPQVKTMLAGHIRYQLT